MARHRLKVGYIGTSISPYFASEYKQRERAIIGLEKLAERLDFELIAVHDEVMTEEGAANAAQYLQDNEVDFLLIQAAACSMGEQLLQLVNAAPRIGLWATPDPEQEGAIKLHSMVSMNHFASIIKRYLKHENIPFKWFYGHVETEEFQRRFEVTARALTAVKNIENARIGWIGSLSPGFTDMIFDERLLRHRMGISVSPHELAELVNRAKAYDPEPVQTTVDEIRAAASAVTVTENSAFDRVTRLYLAMRDMAAEYEYDALAVQCWPNFQSYYKVAPCMAYSWLGSEDGIAVSCEGDLLGAASMYLLNVLTGKKGSSTLLDMTALDPETNAMLMWHCGVSPRHFANDDGIKWVDHVTLGRNSDTGPFGVAGDQVFAAQETTVSYIGDDGSSLLVIRADIIEHEKKGFDGTRGWFSQFELNKQPISLMDLINTLTVRGHEHHFAVGQGDVTDELMEFAAWKGMRLIEHVPSANYLQLEGINV
jgi:L-arabinose isomerase